MRILRVRRGFSTNCSGANEYFPPENVLPPPVQTDSADAGAPAWTPNPATKAVFRWVTLMPDGGPPPMLRKALSVGPAEASRDAGAGDGRASTDGAAKLSSESASDGAAQRATTSVGHDAGAGPAPASPVRGSGGIGLVLFVVVLGALAFFGLERLARGLWQKHKKGSDDDVG